MSTPVVLNHRGTPEPSSEIQRRLQGVHPRLSLRYIEGVDQSWAICMAWEQNDPRWQHVQEQIIDPMRSVDIVGYLPMTCSLAEAPAYLERSLRQFPRADVQSVADHVMKFNATVPVQQAVEKALAEVLDAPDPSKRSRGRPRKT